MGEFISLSSFREMDRHIINYTHFKKRKRFCQPISWIFLEQYNRKCTDRIYLRHTLFIILAYHIWFADLIVTNTVIDIVVASSNVIAHEIIVIFGTSSFVISVTMVCVILSK